MLKKLFNLSIERPRTVITLWLALAAILSIAGFVVGTRTVLPGPTNLDALLYDPIEREAFESNLPLKDMLVVVFGHNSLTYQDAKFVEAREKLVEELSKLRSSRTGSAVFSSVRTAGHSLLEDSHYVSASQRFIILTAQSIEPINFSHEELAEVPRAIAAWNKLYPAFSVGYLSDGTANNELFDLINNDLDRSLFLTLPLTLIILITAFGTFVAAFLPLCIASVALVSALGASALLSHFIGPVSATASQLVVLLVLAIGVDYSLFMVHRIREETRSGKPFLEALLRTRATTGTAVFWSGIIVALSLCGLFLMRDTVLASMALVAICAVFLTLIGALWALPSMIILAERFIRHPTREPPCLQKLKTSVDLIGFSLRRPVLTVVLCCAALSAVSFFALNLTIGSTIEPAVFPPSTQVHRADQILAREFPDYSGIDFSIILKGEQLHEREYEGEFQPFLDALLKNGSVRGPVHQEFSKDDRFVRYQFIALGGANNLSNQKLVHQIKDTLIPTLISPLGIQGTVRGTLPYVVGDLELYSRRSPAVFGAVIAVSLVFLLLAFRSLVIPLKAMLLNILSTLAAFGSLVVIFQGTQILGPTYRVIESFVPSLLFSILFGLSMDYHVYLLSRVKEEYESSGDMYQAVDRAIRRTFRTITSAAVIMVSVFLVLASLELPVMRQLGVGLAVAVILDATIIRCFLLPASLVLLDKWNWYLPKSLSWLPEIRVK